MAAFGIIRSQFCENNFHFAEFDFELDSFIDFLDLTETLIINKLKSDLDKYEFNDIGEEHYIKEKILLTYYSSNIVTIYSFLEKSLLRLCNISLNKDTKITLDDISGTGIFQTKKYIEKVLLIDLKHINKEWSELIKLNQLRNHFVHTSNNKLKKEETKKRINNIRGIKGLELIDMDEYFIINFKNDEFIRSFIKTIKNLLIKIYYEDYNKFSF